MPIVLNGSGTISGVSVGGLPDGSVDADTLAANAVTAGKLASGVGGKILQVQSTTKTDHFSTTSGSLTEVTGLNVSITPSASTSKIYLNIDVSLGGATAYVGFNIKRDSTLIAVTTAVDGNDTRHQGTFGQIVNQNSAFKNAGFNFIDTPNTTSAITYKIFAISLYNSQPLSINRTYHTTNNAYDQGGCSTITATEVAA